MTVFQKAREISSMILESDEFKNLEKAKIDFENSKIDEQQFLKIKNRYSNFLEQIFAVIKLNVTDEDEIMQPSKCSKCNRCK